MIIPVLLSGLFAAVPPAETPPAPAAPVRPPNIVFILSDDAGYADFGFQDVVAADVKGVTPALDKLAARGAVFTQAYVSGVVCSPSRAGIMTGRYQERFGHDNNMRPGGGLPVTETLMPRHLEKYGYATECLGKWHLGDAPQFHPNARGFGHFFGFLQGERDYLPYPSGQAKPNRVFQDDGKPTPEGGYATDRIGQAACATIRAKARAGKPFFQYVAFNAAHAPLQPRPEDKSWLQARGLKGGRGNYIGLIKALDENVAAIVKTLEDEGVADDTLIVFTNDNGGQTASCADNGILRGKKGEMWEGGSRVPFVVVWPGHIKAGQRLADPVIALDLLPTFLAAAGAGERDMPKNLDGVNLLPRLTGAAADLPERPFFWRFGGSTADIAMRRGNLKLVWNRAEHEEPRLFDLAADPGEKTDLSRQRPDDLAKLLKELKGWEAGMIEPLWGPGSKEQPVKGKGRRRFADNAVED